MEHGYYWFKYNDGTVTVVECQYDNEFYRIADDMLYEGVEELESACNGKLGKKIEYSE